MINDITLLTEQELKEIEDSSSNPKELKQKVLETRTKKILKVLEEDGVFVRFYDFCHLLGDESITQGIAGFFYLLFGDLIYTPDEYEDFLYDISGKTIERYVWDNTKSKALNWEFKNSHCSRLVSEIIFTGSRGIFKSQLSIRLGVLYVILYRYFVLGVDPSDPSGMYSLLDNTICVAKASDASAEDFRKTMLGMYKNSAWLKKIKITFTSSKELIEVFHGSTQIGKIVFSSLQGSNTKNTGQRFLKIIADDYTSGESSSDVKVNNMDAILSKLVPTTKRVYTIPATQNSVENSGQSSPALVLVGQPYHKKDRYLRGMEYLYNNPDKFVPNMYITYFDVALYGNLTAVEDAAKEALSPTAREDTFLGTVDLERFFDNDINIPIYDYEHIVTKDYKIRINNQDTIVNLDFIYLDIAFSTREGADKTGGVIVSVENNAIHTYAGMADYEINEVKKNLKLYTTPFKFDFNLLHPNFKSELYSLHLYMIECFLKQKPEATEYILPFISYDKSGGKAEGLRDYILEITQELVFRSNIRNKLGQKLNISSRPSFLPVMLHKNASKVMKERKAGKAQRVEYGLTEYVQNFCEVYQITGKSTLTESFPAPRQFSLGIIDLMLYLRTRELSGKVDVIDAFSTGIMVAYDFVMNDIRDNEFVDSLTIDLETREKKTTKKKLEYLKNPFYSLDVEKLI